MNKESKSDINKIVYSTDASGEQGKVSRVVFPTTIAEIKDLIRKNKNLVLRGGGSGLVGGAVPLNSVVIDFSKMNHILNIDIENKEVEVEPGVILNELNNELDKYSLEFPVKPGSSAICTIGGMIATNASGERAVKYGTTSDWIKELEVITGKAENLKIGKVDMNDFSGMEGITGAIIRAKLKLSSKKERTASLLKVDTLERVVETVRKLKMLKDISMIEFFDKFSSKSLKLEEAYHILVEFESSQGTLKGKEYTKMIEMRDGIYPALASIGYTQIEDPKILLTKFEEFAEWLEKEKVPFYGHIGTGIIHPLFRENEEDKINEMYSQIRKMHGKVSGEHGIGLKKKIYVEETDKKILRVVKKRYDPQCKINCGKVIDIAKPEENNGEENNGEH